MSRIEKNAAGEDVDVSTPEYGCAAPEKAPKPAPKTKIITKTKAPLKPSDETANEEGEA